MCFFASFPVIKCHPSNRLCLSVPSVSGPLQLENLKVHWIFQRVTDIDTTFCGCLLSTALVKILPLPAVDMHVANLT